MKRNLPQRDPFLLPITLTLTGWGLLAIWRVSPEFGTRQTGWFLVAAVALLELIRSPSDLRWIQRYRYLWFTAGLILTLSTLFLGTNPTGAGPRLWLGCCGFYFQPSEILRLLLIAYVASFLAERMALGWQAKGSRLLPTLAPLFLLWGLSIMLLIAQRDLGTGSLFLALFAILLYVVSGRWEILVGAVFLGIAGMLIGYSISDVVQVRIQAWLNPWVDPTNKGYQIVQALISFASGGLFGSGPGRGLPGVVPIVHSDFIFSAIVEEWGFLGGLGMISLMALLVGRAFRIAACSSTRFGMIFATGIAAGIGLQTVMILGGVMRLLPLTGVTLPFVSYGGSSLLTSILAVGFLLKLSGGRQEYPQFQPAIIRLQILAGLCWMGLAATLGWWTLVRAPVLEARTDNPRRGYSQRYSQRGAILDRQERPIAQTLGEVGDYKRYYPWGEVFGTVGYDSLRYGQTGVEASMDPILRGNLGGKDWDSILPDLLYGYPETGQDVRLTLDVDFQKAADAFLGEDRGGVIAIHALQGDILAMVSSPGYDPNQIDETWEWLIAQEDAPLLNRVTQGAYQPGMLLGPFLLWAADQRMPPHSQESYDLTGSIELEQGLRLDCLLPPGAQIRGSLQTALKYGCPGPFAELVEGQGEVWFTSILESTGFLAKPPLRLEETFQADETGIQISSLQLEAVGQGVLQVSPLQVASAYAGLLYEARPAVHLVSAFRDEIGRWQLLPPLAEPLPLETEELEGDLRQAVGFIDEHLWAYTTEAISDQEGSKTGWYVAALPYRNMPILLVVFVENADAWWAQSVGEAIVDWAVAEAHE